jgi:hypothetical protein
MKFLQKIKTKCFFSENEVAAAMKLKKFEKWNKNKQFFYDFSDKRKSDWCITRWPPPSGVNVIKLFTAVSYNFLKEARAFVPGKPFQPSLMFAGKAEA